MTVYIDKYILINTFLNFLILHITKIIIKSKSSNPRLFISSVIGAIYAVLIFFPQAEFVTGACGRVIFSLVLIIISYKSSCLKQYLYSLVTFYVVSFAVGGCGYALLNISQKNGYTNSAMLLCTTVIISYSIITLVSDIYTKCFRYDKLCHKLTITVNDKSIQTVCFFDTGNNLKDPVTKLPVIVTNVKSIKALLPESLTYELLHNEDVVQIFFSFSCSDTKLKLIPYHSVGGDGMMLGFTPSKIVIDDKEINAIIGISSKFISSDKSYNAIINPQLIT